MYLERFILKQEKSRSYSLLLLVLQHSILPTSTFLLPDLVHSCVRPVLRITLKSLTTPILPKRIAPPFSLYTRRLLLPRRLLYANSASILRLKKTVRRDTRIRIGVATRVYAIVSLLYSNLSIKSNGTQSLSPCLLTETSNTPVFIGSIISSAISLQASSTLRTYQFILNYLRSRLTLVTRSPRRF